MSLDALPTLLDPACRGAAGALLALLTAVLLRDGPRSATTRIGAAFAAGLIVQIVSSVPLFEATVPRLWQAPFVGVAIANAVLFWLFARALFDDDFVSRAWHRAVWLAVAVSGAGACAIGWRGWSPASQWLLDLQRATPALFAVLAVVAAASSWQGDLIEKRRRLRLFIVAAGSVYSVALLLARIASPHGLLGPFAATADAAAMAAMVAVVAFALLRVAPSPLLAAPGPAPAVPVVEAPPSAADDRVANALEHAMRVDRAYRVEGMTLAVLAARLDVPEYRLRRLINGRLGHRNFNAYVNGFRLDDARQALADPAQRNRPVLTIALTAGFQSIGPFNRAFKATTGLTPTEYRRRSLAES